MNFAKDEILDSGSGLSPPLLAKGLLVADKALAISRSLTHCGGDWP